MLSLARNIECLLRRWGQGLANKIIEKSLTVWEWEEECSLMYIIFNIWNFSMNGHCKRFVKDFIFSLSVGGDIKNLFAIKVALEALLISLYRDSDLAGLGGGHFNRNLL